jgi:hypothetical protein
MRNAQMIRMRERRLSAAVVFYEGLLVGSLAE